MPFETPTKISRSKKFKGALDFSSALDRLTSARQQSTTQLLKAINLIIDRDSDDTNNKIYHDEQFKVVSRISDMRKAVKESEKELDALKNKRSRIERKYAGNELKKSKKIHNINKEIEDEKKVRKSLKNTLMQYRGRLENLNNSNESTQTHLNSEKNTNESNDGYSSSDSSNQSIRKIAV